MGRKKYFTEEERKAVRREYYRQYYQDNKEYFKEYQKQYRQDNKEHIKQYREDNKEYFKQYRQDNKEHIKEHQKQYRQTPIGRAVYLINGYQRNDKRHNRGECTLTPEWIIENIFTQPCHYCGEEGWEIMGCDRVNNDLPHTPDNVVPCCDKCNKKRGRKDYEEFIKEMGMT